MKNEKENSFEKDSILIFCMMMLGNVFGVLFQLLSGRVLKSIDLYADLNVLFSFYTILIWPASVITYIVTRYVSMYDNRGKQGCINVFLKRTVSIVIGVALFITIVGVITKKKIADFLRINNSQLIVLIIVLVDVALFQAVINGGFQGTKSFFEYGLMTLLGQICKIISLVIVINKNNQLVLLFSVLLCGTIVTMLVGIIGIRKKIKGIQNENLKIEKRELYRYCIISIIANIGLTLLANIDMILVKYYFNDEAGLYSVAIVLGKIITYFAGAIVVVLFPFAVSAGKDTNSAINLLKKSIFYNSFLTVIAAFVLNIIGKYIIYFIYGNTYESAINYLHPVTLLVMPIGIITVIFNYVLARAECRSIISILIIGIMIEILVVVINHSNLTVSIFEMALVLWITLIMSLIKMSLIYKKDKEIHEEEV